MALQKKHKRLLAYTGILGGLAVLALTFFTISQFEKAKYQASVSVQLMCQTKLDGALSNDSHALEDESSLYHNVALYWKENVETFEDITKKNSVAYVGTAVPAYLFSMSTLVAFGLILKHAETAKEKEDEEAVLRPTEE